MSTALLDRPIELGQTIRHSRTVTEFIPVAGSLFDTDGSEIVSVFSIDAA
ncbi:hypothetical protein [Rhodococcus sp. 14-2470-1b]|nr:hypothetical protein [Rhodococcus sp. 14-2470-1b]